MDQMLTKISAEKDENPKTIDCKITNFYLSLFVSFFITTLQKND